MYEYNIRKNTKKRKIHIDEYEVYYDNVIQMDLKCEIRNELELLLLTQLHKTTEDV